MDFPVEKIPDKKTKEALEKAEDKDGQAKRFSEEYGQEEYDFPGDQVNEKDVRDKEMTIYDFVILNGKFGEFAVVDAELTEKIKVSVEVDDKTVEKQVQRIQFCEGSAVIRHQLKKAKEDGNLPLIATIVERTSEKSQLTYRTLC